LAPRLSIACAQCRRAAPISPMPTTSADVP
jgi:hypothetical protein